MTITNTTLASPTYNGNGATTAFATGFQFISNSDLQVVVTDASGVETIKTITTHYTVTGAGVSGGGTVTFLTAPASGTFVNIKSNVTLDQQVDYVEGGAFSAATHEGALDKLTKMIQQVKEVTDRSLTLPIVNQDVSTQTNAVAANYVLRVNTAADALEWASSGDIALATVSAPGSTTQVAYNNADSFAADSGFTYDSAGGVTATKSLTIGGNATAAGYIKLLEDSDNGSNYITITAPAAVTTNTTLTLPDGAGTSTYALTTNGSGTLSWSPVPYDVAFNAGYTSAMAAANLVVQTYGEIVVSRAVTITGESGYIETVATGAKVIVDIEKNGTSIYTTKPEFAISTNTLTAGTLKSDGTQIFAVGDRMTFKVTQIGSTIAGGRLRFTTKGYA